MRFTPFFIPNADERRLVLSEKGDAFSAFETQKGVHHFSSQTPMRVG